MFIVGIIRVKDIVILNFYICQETAIRGKWALTICLMMCWSNWSVQSAWSTCCHPSRCVATDTTFVAAASRELRNVQAAENYFQIHGIRHWKNWLCELNILALMNYTDAHSLFRSPSCVNMKIYASFVH